MLEETIDSPAELLEQVRAQRAATRVQRHAYWLPLLLFGTLVCASAPMYVTDPVAPGGQGGFTSITSSSMWLTGLGGFSGLPGQSAPDTRGVYWIVGLLICALFTGVWYRWHATLTGLGTRVRLPLLVWILATLGVVALSIASFAAISWAWPATLRGTSALLVVAAGLLVLSRVERSRLLTAIALAYTVAACLGVLYNPENLLYRLLSAFGVADQSMPFAIGGTVNVLLPGAVLLLGALVAVGVDLRRR